MVLGMPTTDIESFRRSASRAMSWAQRSEPSPPMQRAVAADAEEDVDVHPLERVDHQLGGLASARGPENGAAELVDGVDGVDVERHRRIAAFRRKTGVAVADAVDGADAVVGGEDLDQSLDDVVEAGTEPAGGDDPDARPGGVVEDPLVRAGALEARLVTESALPRLEELHVPR